MWTNYLKTQFILFLFNGGEELYAKIDITDYVIIGSEFVVKDRRKVGICIRVWDCILTAKDKFSWIFMTEYLMRYGNRWSSAGLLGFREYRVKIMRSWLSLPLSLALLQRCIDIGERQINETSGWGSLR